ncbi:hypothetical protein BU24DRAFT_411056 [Aaosphaeria arxii CBS 175.79]|uniref:Uncharacterized protein n=1 Tax=Aaosphaeria arxii CBS 175.79 TaxID=1450172 RepID=A0A6A5XK10_9PLEO|nr:uncharacterized protein BU24DRAFT_411056 [Aaosphaeria arxii CBS 175.79]KAF2013293.1 hypothetical protein BU24DRAFT_411056 [Aaosphaeria arxii CBS 175.79]
MTAYDDYGMPVGAYSGSESLTHQAYRVTRAFLMYKIKPIVDTRWRDFSRRPWHLRSLLSLGRILIVIWFVTLYWGERSAYTGHVDSCRWENWENWGSNANPHRLMFVADPQLVDPHTYPGRPWPLNTLTVKFTDQYMRRTYSQLQTVLYPDTVFMLGDLFDGGREWSTRTSQSPEKQYRKYGTGFWLREYDRFGKIFFGHWRDGGLLPRPGQPGRKIISSLPGNHDLGFGKGIQTSVRKRFNAYFGDGNRIDVIANHTFVSLDSVSLSAMGQENADAMKDLWEPSAKFLEGVKKQKQRLVQEELRTQQGLTRNLPFQHGIIEASGLASAQLPKFNDTVAEFPTVLLSHVPLYRAPGTPCGPQREHWPPTPPPKGQTEPLENDDRNAISVSGGYQYQNVLHRDITKDVADQVGSIQYAFSGDDHDYCEVVHRGYASGGGGIREITVKSISWAMGVRHPGVVLASLWNPVDELGNPLETNERTLQTHLCLLPDQLGTFIRYATLFGLTVLTLSIRAALVAAGIITAKSQPARDPLLPVTEKSSSAENEKASSSPYPTEPTHEPNSSNSSSTSDRGNLQVRNANTRARDGSPTHGYGLPTTPGKYTYPLVQHAGYFGSSDDEESNRKPDKPWGTSGAKRRVPPKKGAALFAHEFLHSIFKVGGVVFIWYFWLIWKW